MARIKQAIPAGQRNIYMHYSHVHFFILDELRTRGLIGLFFMLGLFGVAFTRIFGIKDHAIRTNTLIFLSLLLFYGSLHGLFLGDRNIAAVALMFTALLTVRRKQELRDRIQRRGIAKPPTA
jgi:O-antigen ligase